MKNWVEKVFNFAEYIFCGIFKFFLQKTGRMLTEEGLNGIKQGIRFLIVGVWNLLCSYVVYALCIWVGMHYLLCHGISFCFSVLHSFLWSRMFVFREAGNIWLTLGKVFLSFVGTGLILQGLLLMLWVDVMGIPEILGPLFNIAILTPVNFVIQKFWAYK